LEGAERAAPSGWDSSLFLLFTCMSSFFQKIAAVFLLTAKNTKCTKKNNSQGRKGGEGKKKSAD
jgi:hypothetical protein